MCLSASCKVAASYFAFVCLIGEWRCHQTYPKQDFILEAHYYHKVKYKLLAFESLVKTFL